jgi:hypothetical protein
MEFPRKRNAPPKSGFEKWMGINVSIAQVLVFPQAAVTINKTLSSFTVQECRNGATTGLGWHQSREKS